MHEALLLIARAIALAHDHWRKTIGRRRPLSGKIAVLEERIEQLEAEIALLRSRLLRVPAQRRPHFRPSERLEILWHAARFRLSVTATARRFCLARQTVKNWRRVSSLYRGLWRRWLRNHTIAEGPILDGNGTMAWSWWRSRQCYAARRSRRIGSL